jgi:hypothetical protein
LLPINVSDLEPTQVAAGSTVHCVGDSWAHHVFVNQDFKAVGAE